LIIADKSGIIALSCNYLFRHPPFSSESPHGRLEKTRREDIHGVEEKKIESFLTHLASEENVAPAIQNQAMNALILIPQNASGQGDRCRPFPKENQCPLSIIAHEKISVTLA
jgi:hypothetical protein